MKTSTKKEGRLNVDLINGPIVSSLLLFAIPLLISYLFQQLYNAIDTMIVGRYLGDHSLAAIGACASIFELMVGFANGVGNGMGIVAAREFGSGNRDQLKKCVAGILLVGVVLSAGIMCLARFGLYPLLEILGTPAEIIEESYSYILCIGLGIFVMFAYNMLSGLLRAIGNSLMPLLFLILSSLLNIVLDIVLITGFDLGILGAAIATVIAQGVSALLCFAYILLRCKELIPSREHFQVGLSLYGELIGQGLSMGLMHGIVSSGSIILQYGINSLGTDLIACHTAARKMFALTCVPIYTLSSAMSTFVPQNTGAGRIDRVKTGIRKTFTMSFTWAAICSIFMLLFARNIIAAFSASSNPLILDNGARFLKITAPFYGILGMLITLRSSLQGLGAKVVPLISSIMELIGKILFTLFLIPKLGYLGVILCEPIIWCFMMAQLYYTFYHHKLIRGEDS